GGGGAPGVGGGRLGGLLTRLGAREPIPAVGFSIWIEALSQGSAA
ncbi:MAG TPA: ATP phosphoribosyltransferase regulatory subunit, partial [Afipia sp.]|nr:ATP phosphoribosyltransferase regulatory subunit [Afipia sp.]